MPSPVLQATHAQVMPRTTFSATGGPDGRTWPPDMLMSNMLRNPCKAGWRSVPFGRQRRGGDGGERNADAGPQDSTRKQAGKLRSSPKRMQLWSPVPLGCILLCAGVGGTLLLSHWRLHWVTTQRCRPDDSQPQLKQRRLSLRCRRCELSLSLYTTPA